jgi:hypothetical protein
VKDASDELRLSKAGIFVRCLLEGADLLRRPAALAFFVPQVLVAGALLLGFASFHRAPLSAVFVPAVGALGGEPAVHYPQFYADLPRIFETSTHAFLAVVLTTGWLAFLIATPDLFLRQPVEMRRAWALARRRTTRAWAVTLPVAAVQLLASVVILQLMRAPLGESPRLLSAAEAAAFGVTGLAQVLAAHALPAIALSGLSAAQAWARSWTVLTRNLVATSGFVLAPRVLELPVRGAIDQLASWQRTVDPEAVVPLLGALILASTAATLVTLGSLARFALHHFGQEEDES